MSPVDQLTSIENLTIADGYHFDPDESGAGVVVGLDSSPRFENVIIRNNRAPEGKFGAGVYIFGHPTEETRFLGCIIENNIAGKGGAGIYVRAGAAVRFEDGIIRGNLLTETLRPPPGESCSPNNGAALGIADGAGFYFTSNTTATILRSEIYENAWLPDPPPQCAVGASGGGGRSLGTLFMRDCVVRDNLLGNDFFCAGDGGGIAVGGPSQIVKTQLLDNTIFGKFGCYGAGLSVGLTDASVDVVNCTVTGNVANHNPSGGPGGGGGVYIAGTNTHMTNVIVAGNYSHENAGAIRIDADGSTIVNCTIAENSARIKFGGIQYFQNAATDAVIRNSIVWGNRDTELPGIPLWEDQIGSDTMTLPDMTYTCIEDDLLFPNPYLSAGLFNITDDPGLNSAYGIGQASPCVDTGSNPGVPADATDVDDSGTIVEQTPIDIAFSPRFLPGSAAGQLGQCEPVVDMGAFEFNFNCDDCLVAGDLNYDSLVNGEDIQPFVDCLLDGTGGEDCGCQCADYVGNDGVEMNDVAPFVHCLLGDGSCPGELADCEGGASAFSSGGESGEGASTASESAPVESESNQTVQSGVTGAASSPELTPAQEAAWYDFIDWCDLQDWNVTGTAYDALLDEAMERFEAIGLID